MTTDQLPSWRVRTGPDEAAAALAPNQSPAPPPAIDPDGPDGETGPKRPSNVIFALLGAAVASGVIGLVLVATGDDEAPVAEPAVTTTVPSDVADDPVDQLAFSTEPESPEIVAPEQMAEEDPVEAAPVTETTSDRRAIFSGGVVYLSGSVPSQEIADAIVAKAGAVVGPDNVVNEYVIDPSVSFDPAQGAPLYVEDLVLFATGSTEIGPQFVPLLDLGVVLMTQNPQVTVDVIGHTDSVGSDATNLRLSQERVNAVLRYWIAAGIDPNRLRGVGRGEAEPLADNTTPEGKQLNRRVEFIISGLLS